MKLRLRLSRDNIAKLDRGEDVEINLIVSARTPRLKQSALPEDLPAPKRAPDPAPQRPMVSSIATAPTIPGMPIPTFLQQPPASPTPPPTIVTPPFTYEILVERSRRLQGLAATLFEISSQGEVVRSVKPVQATEESALAAAEHWIEEFHFDPSFKAVLAGVIADKTANAVMHYQNRDGQIERSRAAPPRVLFQDREPPQDPLLTAGEVQRILDAASWIR